MNLFNFIRDILLKTVVFLFSISHALISIPLNIKKPFISFWPEKYPFIAVLSNIFMNIRYFGSSLDFVQYRHPPMSVCLKHLNFEVAKDLVENGYDNSRILGLLLVKALSKNRKALAKLLIDKGAELNKKDNKGSTPLRLAIK